MTKRSGKREKNETFKSKVIDSIEHLENELAPKYFEKLKNQWDNANAKDDIIHIVNNSFDGSLQRSGYNNHQENQQLKSETIAFNFKGNPRNIAVRYLVDSESKPIKLISIKDGKEWIVFPVGKSDLGASVLRINNTFYSINFSVEEGNYTLESVEELLEKKPLDSFKNLFCVANKVLKRTNHKTLNRN